MSGIGWGLLLLAAGLGARHAIAVDHLAAVTTFVRATRVTYRQAIYYALRIGGGHATGMLMMAVVIFFVAHSIPSGVVGILSRISGLWLMLLSLWVLLDLMWPDGRLGHQRLEAWARQRRHRVGPVREPTRLAAWSVGLILGVAVSPGDLAIFTLALAHEARPVFAVALLAIFLTAMMAGLAAVGLAVSWRGDGKAGVFSAGLSGMSGLFGMGIGLVLALGTLH